MQFVFSLPKSVRIGQLKAAISYQLAGKWQNS